MACHLCLLRSAFILGEDLCAPGCPRSGLLSSLCSASVLGREHVWSQTDPSASKMPQLIFFLFLPSAFLIPSRWERWTLTQ